MVHDEARAVRTIYIALDDVFNPGLVGRTIDMDEESVLNERNRSNSIEDGLPGVRRRFSRGEAPFDVIPGGLIQFEIRKLIIQELKTV